MDVTAFFGPQETAPAWDVREQVYKLLASDAKLQQIFSGKIFSRSVLTPPNANALPDLAVTSYSNDAQPGAGMTEDSIVVYLTIREAIPRADADDSGIKGTETVIWHIERVLMQGGARQLSVTINGQVAQLSDEAGKQGIVNYRSIPVSADQIVNAVQIPWIYKVKINSSFDPASQPPTMRIQSLEQIGG